MHFQQLHYQVSLYYIIIIINYLNYLFKLFFLKEKAVDAAKAAGQSADTFYCLRLVEETGICIVPGSGFGQKDGTWHFRITILPPEDQIDEATTLLKDFHEKFITKYS